jgi:hypothetical protein
MLATLVTITGAIIATMLMASLMYALVWDGFQHGDTIRLVGTDTTKQPARFLSAGMITYLATGLVLCWLYYLALSFLNLESFIVSAGIGGAIGFVTGFAMMYWSVYEFFAIEQTDQKYSKYWIPTAFAHWFGHTVFGFSLGTMISAFLHYGMDGFLISALVNLLATGGVLVFARKGQILDRLRHRTAHG